MFVKILKKLTWIVEAGPAKKTEGIVFLDFTKEFWLKSFAHHQYTYVQTYTNWVPY